MRHSRLVASLGKAETRHYIDDYCAFIEAGGKLKILPYPEKSLIDALIAQAPLCVAVNYPTLRKRGHTRTVGVRHDIDDDTINDITTHAVIVYGIDENGEYNVADPWGGPALYTVSPDHLVASIMAAQWLCDNMLFFIQPKS